MLLKLGVLRVYPTDEEHVQAKGKYQYFLSLRIKAKKNVHNIGGSRPRNKRKGGWRCSKNFFDPFAFFFGTFDIAVIGFGPKY